MLSSFRSAVAAARRDQGLYFAALLPEERILDAFGTARALWQGWLYTPAATVWVFLAQCLSADHSCWEAVQQFLTWRLAAGLEPCSSHTGAYCTARSKLPEHACRELVRCTGRDVEEEAPPHWLWKGRAVRVVDGSTITMADTPANQAEYPQLASQAAGCGFPIARILVVFSLAVGTVLEAVIGRYEGKLTGENSMFRTVHALLEEGDVVLADRYFSGWFDIALLAQRRVDIVVRKHQLRATDFRTGQRLGKDDHLVCWEKPARPSWMSPERVRNELYMHLLAYNLIRRAMAVAAFQVGAYPWQISFKATLQSLDNFLPILCSRVTLEIWCEQLFIAISSHEVGNRPDRYEPRLKKKRPNRYKFLREPRANYKKRMATRR